PDEGVAVQRDPSACFVSELGQQRRRVVDLRNHFQTGLTVGVERGLGMHRFLVGRGVTTAYDRGGRTAFGTYLLIGVIDATPAAAARAGCDREADGRAPGWEGCARANRGTTNVVHSRGGVWKSPCRAARRRPCGRAGRRCVGLSMAVDGARLPHPGERDGRLASAGPMSEGVDVVDVSERERAAG